MRSREFGGVHAEGIAVHENVEVLGGADDSADCGKGVSAEVVFLVSRFNKFGEVDNQLFHIMSAIYLHHELPPSTNQQSEETQTLVNLLVSSQNLLLSLTSPS